jgi:hypothetical protein
VACKAMRWSVTAANAVPEPNSMLLLGLAGLFAARRKSAWDRTDHKAFPAS